jgi:hypothetical protein
LSVSFFLSATHLQYRSNFDIDPLAVLNESALRVSLLKKNARRVVGDVIGFMSIQVLEYLKHSVNDDDDREERELRFQKQRGGGESFNSFKTLVDNNAPWLERHSYY